MNNFKKVFGIIFVTAIIVCVIAACDLFPKDPEPEPEETNQSQPSNPSSPTNPSNPPSTAQTLSVTISGTGDVGKDLRAVVSRNPSGEIKYQWLVDGQIIPGEEFSEYVPFLTDPGKKISVRVTCGGQSATSPSITIKPVTYTVELYRFGNAVRAVCKIGDYNLSSGADNGFSTQWLRNSTNISGAIYEWYELQPEDLGKTISVRVSGYNKTVTSSGILVTADMLQ
jgi:hypothetical protein